MLCTTSGVVMFWLGLLLLGVAGKTSVRFDDALTGVPPDQFSELPIESGPRKLPPFHVSTAPIACEASERPAIHDDSTRPRPRRERTILHLHLKADQSPT